MKAYIDNKGHLFLKRNGSVLHINRDLNLINLIDGDHLENDHEYNDGSRTNVDDYKEISLDLFKEYLSETLNNLEINELTNN